MRVIVGLSGGVDSSVAASLLKEDGHEVIGVCMKIWDGKEALSQKGHACYGPGEEEDIDEARRVAETLDIDFHVFDLSEHYKKIVLGYFRDEYLSGKTPNPCLRCNPLMKFHALPEAARRSGIKFDRFATGHYAKVVYDQGLDRHLLMKARDLSKDQSYGLVFLTQEQLSETLLPLGELTKKEVRKIAAKIGLKTADIPDSQDFYSGDYADLIGADANPGPILDTEGNVIGEHLGLWNYTIGQRKGLGVSTKEPVYVRKLDTETNSLIVARKEELYGRELTAGKMNYISIEALEPRELTVRIRHTTENAPATVKPLGVDSIHVKFREPQWAVTPGQIAALYDEDVVVGGGIIDPC